MNAGDIYEVGIGLVFIYGGGYLLLMLKGYLPLRPSEEKRKQAEEWRKKYGTLAYFMGPISVIFGVYHIISIIMK